MVFFFATMSLLATMAASPQPGQSQDNVRLALMHGVPVKWDVESNFKAFLGALDEVKNSNPGIFVTPECWLDGYAAPDPQSTVERLRSVAQDIKSSDYLKRVASEARERHVMICFGFTSLEEDKIFNAAGLWDAEGKLVGVYHKTHLQKHDLQFSFGEGLPVWPTSYGKIGVMICADRRWPETPRTLRLKGARLILNPTYGFSGEMNEAIMRTRSYENQCFIAFAHPKASLVTGPGGKVLAKWEGGTPGVLICDIDLSQAKDDNHLQDRRPELYGVITAPKGKE